jgi:hypothetical protein
MSKSNQVLSAGLLRPLLIIAGLPKLTARVAASSIESACSPWQAIAIPFADSDEIYTDSAVQQLMVEVCTFAQQQRNNSSKNKIPAPSRIILCYVDKGSVQKLLSSFGFACYPTKIKVDNWNWLDGKHWRFHIETVVSALKGLINASNDGVMKSVRLRLEARSASDPLLLPPRNFLINSGLKLESIFSEAVRTEEFDIIDQSINIKRCNKENLKEFFSRTGGSKKDFAIDSRSLVYATSSRGQHGAVRAKDDVSKTPQIELRLLLESLYRFGTPLPSGFQHDAQFEYSRLLDREQFECSAKGMIEVSGTHANVYPDDVVRPP